MTGARYLRDGDILPLTCTRAGTCCHGKDIRITPWELARLARGLGLTAVDCRDRYTVDAGSRLAMAGVPGWRGLHACALYDPATGCTAHAERPLACRLYPLGRELRGGRARIMHEGRSFPCLAGCPEVASLPQQRVGDYLRQQGVAVWAPARDAYLDVAQDLAEGAFVLVFDSGLARLPERDWFARWQRCVAGGAAAWRESLGGIWLDRVTAPNLDAPLDDGLAWVAAHAAALQLDAQAAFATLRDPAALSAASATMLAGALLLMHAVGGDAAEVGGRWLATADRGGR